jgi:hypothetical protein
VVWEILMLYDTVKIWSKLVNITNYEVCSWHDHPMSEQLYRARILPKIYWYFSDI